ncbi:cytochrome c3 family protein [Geobacter sulfurreducens]|uniref:cytochrome c3 family protein n=1 Tax=Geobacter sulfurreducens TaxID=35554 RepID=UPI002BED25E7|nr:cytochrome c3 family protein [Geobacter sulfurreducens]HML79385.1 cytochrome c3 family protein [Geobacter sulfurreducens]
MRRHSNKTNPVAAGILFITLACWAGNAMGWGTSGDSRSTWGGSGSSLNLNLAFTDCAKCHTSTNNVNRHHDLITKKGKQCLACHTMTADNSGQYTVQVQRDCQACHTSSVHDNVQHNVSTCSRCHGSDVINIHSGWRSYTSTLSVCYLCHTSTNAKVKATIAKGVSGQTVYCTDCHGNNPHSWGGTWGR